jgi:hypothetical protein
VPTATPPPSHAPTATYTPAPRETAFPVDARYAVVGVEIDDVLNVRAGAGVAHAIVGTIPPYGTAVEVTGPGQGVAGSTWVPVRYREIEGCVNGRYLARQEGQAEDAVAARALEAILAIRDKDLVTLSALVHPEKGLRFSPYAYVRVGGDPDDRDLVYDATEIAGLAGDETVRTWGIYDGVGTPIELTFDAYWAHFCYDVDFAGAHVVGYNQRVGWGNTIDNIAEVYPEAVTVEYHFTGFDPQYGGMDWRSLRLVLEEWAGRWYLVGLVHDEWTI